MYTQTHSTVLYPSCILHDHTVEIAKVGDSQIEKNDILSFWFYVP